MNFESALAKSVFESKYLLETEKTADEAVERVVQTVSKMYPEIEQDAREFISKQWFLPAGGVWRAAGNPNKNVSFINCTNLGHIEDNLEGIFTNAYKWAKYGAYGQGEGQDISLLRPKGAKVHNSSQSSTGAVSFMYIYDMILKIIAQKGRRGASLISMIDHHPDIFDFVKVKDKPESDASRIDTCNISVKATDAFMQAVKDDADWLLWFENKYERIEKVIKAREVFDAICYMAWKRGDPGLQFIDTWRRYSNSDPLGYPLEASNACVTGDTLVHTPNGTVRVDTLKEGDMILVRTGQAKQITSVEVSEHYTYRVLYQDGNDIGIIDVTKNHVFYNNGREIRTFQLTEGVELDSCSGRVTVISVLPNNRRETVYDVFEKDTDSWITNGLISRGCGEIPADKDNVCMLGHLNLAKYREYGHDGFVKLIKFQVKFLNACRLTEYLEKRSPVPEQREKLITIPRVGGGDTGFADYLLDKGIPYDSDEAIREREYIGKTMAKSAY
jgi:ribonucleotide reductase alpha subunit